MLAWLVDKLLVTAEPDHADTMRYRLLQATRAYAGERLHKQGVGSTIALVHARFFLALA